jgi:hypothetical protein
LYKAQHPIVVDGKENDDTYSRDNLRGQICGILIFLQSRADVAIQSKKVICGHFYAGRSLWQCNGDAV